MVIKRKKIFWLIFIIVIFLSAEFITIKFTEDSGIFRQQWFKPAKKSPAPFKGKMAYDVKFGKLRLGTAVLQNLGETNINGQLLNTIIFRTDVGRFSDVETIYSDPKTFLPIKINREISNWFRKEVITEDYDQNNFTLTITNHNRAKEDKVTIKRDGPIHNAILLLYFGRNILKFDKEYIFDANLPNNKFQIRLVSTEDIQVPAGSFKAYHFESSPKQIEIWISADEYNIPVKMQGIGAFGYSMELKK